jgi:pyruvate/2-oxoglutarate dehydrogenase complex dihydrolipoamide dehydrogenase (E3) component
VGPDWKKNFVTKSSTSHSQNHSLLLEFNVEAQAVMARGAKASWLFPSVNDKETELAEIKLEEVTREWPLAVQLTNGKIYGCDLIICAIGVIPNTELVKNFVNLSNSGGIIVDKNLQTPIYKNIYAFGDCSTVQVDSECWFQMRLWSQARMMGRKAAQVIMECAHIEGGLDFEV